MKISQINNSNPYQNFKGAYKISIPRNLFADKYSDFAAQDVFRNALINAIAQKPINKMDKFLDKIGLKPVALSFLNFPGYKILQEPIQKNGKVWVEQHLNYRYNLYDSKMNSPLHINIPEISKENFDFFLITGKEKKALMKEMPSVRTKARDLYEAIEKKIVGIAKKPLQEGDETLLEKISLFYTQHSAFKKAVNNEITLCEVKKLEDLQGTLLELLNLD